ncbi:MAG: ABC transporter permease [Chloroflexi bacterium]|nr:ABC transporter permease [Chloroflexota bacterium]
MQTHRRKILRDIWTRKARTALVSASIFIGVLGVVALFSMGDIMVDRLEKTIQANKLSMTHAYVIRASTDAPDNEADLAVVRNLPNVTAVQGFALYPIYWKMAGDVRFKDARMYSYTAPIDQLTLEPPTLVKGRYPVAGHNEIAVERRFATENKVDIGDTIVIRILSGAGSSGEIKEETWTIVGTVYQPYQYPVAPGAPEVVRGEVILFPAYEDAQYIGGFKGFNMFQVRYTNYQAALDGESDLKAAIAADTSYRPTNALVEDPAKNTFIEQTRSLADIMAILAVVALIVSGFLVFNVINSIVVEQRRQIGVMKSLGAMPKDNFAIYTGISLIYGIIGVIPGVLLGIPAGFQAAKAIGLQFNVFIEDFQTSVPAIILGILLGLLVPVLASLLPVAMGIRVTILQAMTDLGIQVNYGEGRFAELLDRLPLPISIRQALRNVVQKKARLALTMITLGLAAGAFMGVYAMLSQLTDTVNAIYGTFGNQITFNPTPVQDRAKIEALVRDNVDGIKAIEPGAVMAIEIEGFKPKQVGGAPPLLYALGNNPNNREILNFNFRSGTGWENDPNREGIVITTGIANQTGKDTGDTIHVKIGATSADMEIIGVAIYPFDTVWFRWDTLAKLGGLVDADGNPRPNSYHIIMAASDPSVKQTDDKIDEINEVLLKQGITATYTNWVQSAEYTSQVVATAGGILNTAAALIAAVGAIGLLSTLSMSVFERQKEIGVMRSIGATSFAVALQFLVEGLIVGLVAWLIGIPISYWLNGVLADAFNFGDAFVTGYPFLTLVIGFVGTMVIATIASLWPSIAAARKTVSDILRYQ